MTRDTTSSPLLKLRSGCFAVALHAAIAGSLVLCGCGEEDTDVGADDDDLVEIEGEVMGTALPVPTLGFVHKRLANTQLNADPEPALVFYFAGERRVLDRCPDAVFLGDAAEPYLGFSVYAQNLRPGTYPLCVDFGCEGTRAEASGLFQGWQVPGLGMDATGGSVVLTALDGERVAGTFALEFEDEVVSGEFDVPISCTDDRNR